MNSVLPADITRVVVLGHSGFIGVPLTARFKENFHDLEIVGFSSAECDLSDGQCVESLSTLFDDKTLVIVCSGIKKQWGDSLDIFSKNLLMTTNLCRLLETRPVRRLVYFSSAEVYGEDLDDLHITEMTPVSPTSYYGMAKYASERLLWKVADSHGISLLLLRPPLVYGAGDTSRGYGPSGFIWAAVNRETVTLWGDGTELRSLIFIDDLVDIVSRLTFDSYEGVVNVTDSRSASFRQLLEILSSLVPEGIPHTLRPRTKAKVDNAYCTGLLQRLLPGLSFTPLEEGMGRTLATVRRMGATSP